MNNRKKGQDLILSAERLCERDLEGALREGDFSMAVRRAQEVADLALKGGLAVLGVEYPKIHDVGTDFADDVRKKIGEANRGTLDRIARVSTHLCEERGPAFYGEKPYREGEARQAHRDAIFVLGKGKGDPTSLRMPPQVKRCSGFPAATVPRSGTRSVGRFGIWDPGEAI